MKNMKYNMTFGIALVCAVLFTACDNFSPEIHTPVESGYGRISVSFAAEEDAPQQARTVLPSTVFDKYEYTFTKEGEETGAVKIPDNEGFFTLEVGEYTAAVRAFIGEAEPYTLAASGVSLPFSVGPGNNDSVEVFLSGVDTNATGEFSYTITFPAGAVAEITLKKWPGLTVITLDPENLTQGNGITETLELEAGSYLLTISISKNGLYAGKSEAVHIHPHLPTEYTAVFDENSIIHVLLDGITAEYTQTGIVYNATPLDNLKADITVTASYNNDTPRILPSSAYSLSGTLSSGTSTITVSHTEGNVTKTATFTVTVTQAPAAGLYGKAPPISASDTPLNTSGWSGNLVDVAVRYVNSYPNRTYTLVLDSDIDVAGGGRVLNQSDGKLIIIGFGEVRKIRLTSQGNMFMVGASGKTGIELTIGENIALEGLTNGVNGATQHNSFSVVGVVSGSRFTMQGNASVSGNTSFAGGGVIVQDGGTFIMRDNTSVFGNAVRPGDGWSGTGGGVYVGSTDSSFIMQDNASVAYNTASTGGGVYLNDQYSHIGYINETFVMLGNASVTNNTANGSYGTGGVHIESGGFHMRDNSSVTNNTGRGVYLAAAIRTGLAVYGGAFIMRDNALISGNVTNSGSSNNNGNNGGGVYVDGGEFQMNGGTISYNTASLNGGGVWVGGGGLFAMNGGTISNNTAYGGGGLCIGSSTSYVSGGNVNSNGTFRMRGGTISNNTATSGNAIRNLNGTAEYGDGTTILNSGTTLGGPITGR